MVLKQGYAKTSQGFHEILMKTCVFFVFVIIFTDIIILNYEYKVIFKTSELKGIIYK